MRNTTFWTPAPGLSVANRSPPHAMLQLRSPPTRNRSKMGPSLGIVAGQQVSSPRLRGCSPRTRTHHRATAVVPAPAGLFPTEWRLDQNPACRPRACGAVPARDNSRDNDHDVVPAPAGLFPAGRSIHRAIPGRPRACGAVPPPTSFVWAPLRSSPRLRGCSRHVGPAARRHVVVPAPAGLFRRPRLRSRTTSGRPRACGAVPAIELAWASSTASSPRLRGCSPRDRGQPGLDTVVPAPAGLFPVRGACGARRSSRPRACGAVPTFGILIRSGATSSPRLRGCSVTSVTL